MFDALFSIFGSMVSPRQYKPAFRTCKAPSYLKTVEEAFRRDWEAIGGDMQRAIDKVGTKLLDRQNQGALMKPIEMAPLDVQFRPEEDHWLAECPALGILTQGKNFTEAEENLKEAIVLFLESCLRRGTLERVLFEAGFEPVCIKKMQDFAWEYMPVHTPEETRCHV